MKRIARASGNNDAYNGYVARYTDRRASDWIGMFSFPAACVVLLAVPPVRNYSPAIAMVVAFGVKFMVLWKQRERVSIEIAELARGSSDRDLPLLLRLMDLKYCESIREIGAAVARIASGLSSESYAALPAAERAQLVDIVSRCLRPGNPALYSADLCVAIVDMLGRSGNKEVLRRLLELEAEYAPIYVRDAIRRATKRLDSVAPVEPEGER